MRNSSPSAEKNTQPASGVSTKKNRAKKAKFFFFSMALIFLVVALLGFFPSAIMMRNGDLGVHWLTHVHSAVMTSWLLLFFGQNILSVSGNLKLHRRMGILSLVIALLIVIMLCVVSFNVIIFYNVPEGSAKFDLLIGGFYEMFGFAFFFTWGMLARKKNLGAHKRLLTMATIVLLEAAVDRIQLRNSFPSFGFEYPATNFIYADILYIPLFIYDLVTLKKLHRVTVIGTALVISLQIFVCSIYGSPAWHKFWYSQTSPFMSKPVEIKITDAQSTVLLGDYISKIGKIRIGRENGQLFVQFDDGQKQELGASAETILFSKQEGIWFNFVKGSDGRVNSARVEQTGLRYDMTRIEQR